MAKQNNELQILKAIQQSKVPVGAVHLSGELGIPSANIGRTLLQLEQDGMIEKVQNKGRVITKRGETYLEEWNQRNKKIQVADELIRAASAENGRDLQDILLVRQLLEGYTAALCAEKIAPETLTELEDIQFDYIYEVKHGRSGSEEDLKFHLKIAEIAGSRTITWILNLILTDKDAYAEFTRAAMGSNGLKYNEHELILDAIRKKDGERARAEMEKHLSRVIDNVQHYYKEQNGETGHL